MLIEFFVSLYSILAMSMPPKLTSQQRSFLRALGQQDKLTPRTAPSSPTTSSALDHFQGQNRSRSRAATFRRAVGTPLPVSVEAREQAKDSLRLLHRKMKKTALDKKRGEVLMAHRAENKEERRIKAKAEVDRVRKQARGAAGRRARQLAEHASALHQQRVTTEHLEGLEQPNIVSGKSSRLKIGGRRTKKRRKRVKRRKTRRKHRTRRKRSKGRRRKTRRR